MTDKEELRKALLEDNPIKEMVEGAEDVAVEVIKAPFKVGLRVIEDLFNWFDL